MPEFHRIIACPEQCAESQYVNSLDNDRAEVEAHQYAESLFLSRELFATRRRMGILVLVSIFERRVVVLPDTGLSQRLNRDAIETVIACMAKPLASARVANAFEDGLSRLESLAEVINDATRRTITERLRAHEAGTGNQIAVLTVPTIGDDSIEEYAVAVFEGWKLGEKGKDNGVLVIIVPNDRRMRIEVGYGLEGVLTDSIAGQIIRNVMTPRFKAGDFNGGIEAGVQSVIDVLEKGALPEMARDQDFVSIR